ncbi:MAG: PQQ-dependent catabolism-associated CXXCW motif protein [Rhodopila sp.]
MMSLRLTSLLAGLAVLVAAAPVTEPTGYRMEDYRAPTSQTLSGARVVTTSEAHALWAERRAAFIDVLPQPPRPPDLPPSTLWRPRPRLDIPGSIWLPDTGYGALAPAMETYFAQNLNTTSAGDRARILVFYCLQNCWMSWNAAKRAMALGYRNVIWYPDGTDGWAAQGFPLELRAPEPRPSATE